MNCQECDKILRNKRSDAKFCSHNCKVKFHNQKKQRGMVASERQKLTNEQSEIHTSMIENQIAVLEQRKKPIKVELANLIQSRNEVLLQTEIVKAEVSEVEEDIENWLDEIALDDDSFYELHFDKQEQINVKHLHWAVNPIVNLTIKGLDNMEKENKVQRAKERLIGNIEELTEEIKEKECEVMELTRSYQLYTPIIKEHLKKIKEYNNRIEKLKLSKIEPVKVIRPVIPIRAFPAPKKSNNGIGGADLLNMTFNTFQLTGGLGRFLGELDRNMTAFALTGDSGAGKSYFSFELAKTFIDYGFSCKYFSMEEGLGKLTQDKLKVYDLGNDITLCGNATLNEVRKDAKAFDLIIIDSFQKLNVKPDEFEKLRQDFPETVFIIIFQKTTAGTMRGGSSIKFNSSANIDVQLKDGERIAVMEKGRYGTIGWVYSISEGVVVNDGR
jgi:hypothetical protein